MSNLLFEQIRALNIGSNYFGDEGFLAIVDALHHIEQDVRLFNCKISNVELEKFANKLSESSFGVSCFSTQASLTGLINQNGMRKESIPAALKYKYIAHSCDMASVYFALFVHSLISKFLLLDWCNACACSLRLPHGMFTCEL